MNLFASGLKKIFQTLIQLPVIYTAALLLQPLVLWTGWNPPEWSLRGGLWTQFIVEMIVWLIAVGAIIQAWQSRLPKIAKLGLTALQAPGLGLLSVLIGRMTPIVLIFGLGICRITSNSPSGGHSITIESACFMGCSHTAYVNQFIFEREIGSLSLPEGRFCSANPTFTNPTFTWNQAETEVTWQIRNQSGLIRL